MNWYVGVMIPLSLLVESSLSNHIRLGGAKPDIVLVITMLAGLLFGSGAGGAMGLLGGLLQDLMLGRYIGLFAFTRTLAGIVSGAIGVRLFKENPFVPSLLCFGGSIVCDLVTGGLVYFVSVGFGIETGQGMFRVVLMAAAYNALLAQPVAFVIKRLASGTSHAPGV